MRQDPPELLLLHSLAAGTDAAVVAQERRGQQNLVAEETLPTRGLECAAQLGIEVLGPEPGDRLFSRVKLPPGWKKVSTDHALYTDLVDAKGRLRASIMYKAASYDRDAFMTATRRYTARFDYERKANRGDAVAYVADAGSRIYETLPRPLDADSRKSHAIIEEAEQEAREWLERHYPNHRDVAAYWD